MVASTAVRVSTAAAIATGANTHGGEPCEAEPTVRAVCTELLSSVSGCRWA
jgi:hypothetical protein